MIKEHDCVVLTSDLPRESLLSGDVGTVVHIHGNAAAHQRETAENEANHWLHEHQYRDNQ